MTRPNAPLPPRTRRPLVSLGVALVPTCACVLVFLGACNMFQGFQSFSGTPRTTPTPGTEGSSPDTGTKSRTGSVDVRSKLPEGARSPSPRPSLVK